MCKILKSPCVTGCQYRPLPGHKFCRLHVDDAGALRGSDLILRLWVISTGHKSSSLHSCLNLQASASRSKFFAFRACNDEYPALLASVQQVARSRRFVCQTITGRMLSLLNGDVPDWLRVQHAQNLPSLKSKNVGSRPALGNSPHSVRWSRRQWLQFGNAKSSQLQASFSSLLNSHSCRHSERPLSQR